MKISKILFLSVMMPVSSLVAGCNDDGSGTPLEEPFIYLTQAAFESPYAVPDNYEYEDGSDVVNIPLSVHRAGMSALDAYSVKLNVLDEVVEGTEKLPEGEYSLPSVIDSPEGVRTCEFSLDLDLDFLRSGRDAGKVYSIVMELSDPSKYYIEESMARLAVRIDADALLKDADLYYDWQLLFSDEFGQTGVNTADWAIYDEPYGHNYIGTLKPEAFSIKDGVLNCTCYMDEKYERVVTGGMKHKTPFKYGRIEFRAKSSLDPYNHVGGVILTWPASEKWPQDGEMDIYEITQPSVNALNTFIHYPDFGDPTKDVHIQFLHDGLDRTVWHDFRLDWLPDCLYLYVDGERVWELTDERMIPQSEHRLVIQSGSTVDVIENAVTLEVDYVRVYQDKSMQ